MKDPCPILRIAVPSPLRQCFDYLPPQDCDAQDLSPGIRLEVPFGKTRKVVGLLLGHPQTPECDPKRLKHATRAIDTEPVLTAPLLRLLTWASKYYHHPIGEVMMTALPALLRAGQPATLRTLRYYRLAPEAQAQAQTKDGRAVLRRARRQAALIELLQRHPGGLTSAQLRFEGFETQHIKPLIERGWVAAVDTDPWAAPQAAHTANSTTQPLTLNQAQRAAIETITAAPGFSTFLLDGVTGSGKTEVYLQVIDRALKQGQQAMVLVPEIGLTPQTVERFSQRFSVNIAVLHSNLTDRERLDAWLLAKAGRAPIIIGTRSAIFTPMPNPGVIILDEEHDHSFKQQSGFRYSARDLAVMRGQLENVPVILGSATPSFETLHNGRQDRYQTLKLPERAGAAVHPTFRLVDLRCQRVQHGISPELKQIIQSHLEQGSQVLLFLNRRGYAPVMLCHSCGWAAECSRCDARLTLHQRPKYLGCHHCGAIQPVPPHCPQCQSSALMELGLGTERIETGLQSQFPEYNVVRIDRDTTQRRGALEAMLDKIKSGESQILVGTQMLAKGHHFPDVTLVGILDVDSALFSADFRANEQLAQLIIQVAGRAGRAEKPGEVCIQTHNPRHKLLQRLVHHGYHSFAEAALAERHEAGLPPSSYNALLRAEATNKSATTAFLDEARTMITTSKHNTDAVKVLGPIPSPMARKAGHHRAQLLFEAVQRRALQHLLTQMVAPIAALKSARRVRWSLDVDPIETG